ncbi:hypothetical protein [Cellulomonas sp. URHD0024]|uniref:hypothetical protein n=1 Tax=Cellulomonas sp. URHD0024 TaxID=1302620 RepID=UPI0004841577|nr:hypothetical protein [Cellulomonas sp. URHD0024]
MITRDYFASEFDVAIVERSGGLPDHAFAAPGAGARAVEVAVEPWGAPMWTATFAAPDLGVRALTAVIGTPSPTGLCVVERGTAFVGDVLEPAVFSVVETRGPVVDAEELPADGLLLLLTPWSITAVGQLGRRWTSERLAIDGLRVDEASDGWLRGVADPDDDEPRDFALNLATGEVVGGAGIA